MTAHELARKLLAGGDHELVLLDVGATHGFNINDVVLMNGMQDNCPMPMPVIALTLGEPNIEVFPLTRSQVG